MKSGLFTGKTVYIHEPTDLQCGQAVIAMAAGVSVQAVVELLLNDRETTLAEMRAAFDYYGIKCAAERKQAQTKAELPQVCLLSLETPRCWHWSFYRDGVFYDPEHGVLDDFPECKRKYYWQLF